MDYNFYSRNPDYFALLSEFDEISKVAERKINHFEEAGHDLENTYVFGFSFGAQISLQVGRNINSMNNGTRLISRMDGKKVVKLSPILDNWFYLHIITVCEPTAVGFPKTVESVHSARNVQCIHTNSGTYGTRKRDCHQDWNLGICGNFQVAHGKYPKGMIIM